MRRCELGGNCDEIFHIGPKCKKLYLILSNDADEESKEPLKLEVREANQTEPHVSLNVVDGQFQSDTIKLQGKSANQI